MAITDTQKVDYLWKKIGYGATKTDTNTNKKAPNEAIASPLLLRGDKVWQQASSIPGVLPGSSAGVVTVYPTAGPDECSVDATSTANRTWKTGLANWIPPELGSTYQVKVYVHTAGSASAAAASGDQVFATGSGNDDEWFFDYQSGVLHFVGASLPDGVNFTGKSVYISGGRYTGTFGVGTSSGEDALIGNITVSNVTFTSTTSSDDIIFDAETGVVQITGSTGFVIPIGTTAQRSGSPETGLTRYNSSTGLLELYDGSGWEGIGDYTPTVDNFDGDGSTVAFTISASSTTDGLIVDVNGVLQLGGTAYSVSTTTLTFTEAPATGDKITARFLTKTLYNAISDAAGSTTQVQFNDAGSTGADAGLTYNKTTDALTVGGTLTIGGLLQAPQATKLANATGTLGQISWDDSYIYVCTATNTWKRVALTGGY